MSDHLNLSRIEIRASRAMHGARSRAFTMIELLVVLGIVMVLIGLMLPGIGGAIGRSRLTRDSGIIRQHAATFEMYTRDWDGVYPVAKFPGLWSCAQAWYQPLLEVGYFDSVVEADPVAVPKWNQVRFYQSIATFYDADLMLPGKVPPYELQHPVAVRGDQLLFPSDKGILLMFHTGPFWLEDGAEGFCCAGTRLIVPVAMGDGSVTTGSMWDFLKGENLYLEYGIGAPVISTWGGYRARDRR